MGEARTRVYRKGVLEAEDFPVADVSDYLEEPDTIVWVDFCAPTKAQLARARRASSGCTSSRSRTPSARTSGPSSTTTPRTCSCRATPCGSTPNTATSTRPRSTRSSTSAGSSPSARTKASRWTPCSQRWDRSPDLAAHGVSFLLYGLLDVVVDSYFDAVQAFDDFYDEVSEGIFSERPLDPAQQRHWFEMRRALVRFHRLVVPMREVVSALMRREHTIISEDLYPYYQDVYDHILRVSESTDSLRDLVSTIVETNLSLRDYRQNQIMKKVSSWAAIIAVPALITGYYGMNVPYPGFARHSGFVASTALIVIISGALYAIFRRQDWL